VQGDQPVAELMEVAASTAPLLERAQRVVEGLGRWAPSEAAWLALTDPGSNVYQGASSAGLDQAVTEYLDRPAVAKEIEMAGYDRNRSPVSVRELPMPVEELPTWAECLIPAGFKNGLGVPLFDPGGQHVGILSLLFCSDQPPSSVTRTRIEQAAPLIARALSPMRSLLATARIVQGVTAGVVLLRDGTTCPLQGLDDHALLDAHSPVVEIARGALLRGQVYRSFMWPTPTDRAGAGHARLTVMAANEPPTFILGMVLVTPDVTHRGLTPRELEVLGLLVDGRSNQQIAKALVVAPRTVAAHVEHLLEKLESPTRTLAAVRAEREGCYVPHFPARLRPR
jgi:DNA-binding CsgD family transcriptional regulator